MAPNPSVLVTGVSTAEHLDDFARTELGISADAPKVILPRCCFVTVGSSKAGFRALLEEVISEHFLKFMKQTGYQDMAVQCGPDLEWFEEQLKGRRTFGIKIHCFDFTDEIYRYYLCCRGEYRARLAGCVIAHCGSGTILEVMRYHVALIAVPNPTLADNHQQELAEVVDKNRWAVFGQLGHLTDAVQETRLRTAQGRLDDLPPFEEPVFPPPEEDRSTTIFDWMVLTCYPDAMAKATQMRATAQHGESVERELSSGCSTTAAAAGRVSDIASLQMD